MNAIDSGGVKYGERLCRGFRVTPGSQRPPSEGGRTTTRGVGSDNSRSAVCHGSIRAITHGSLRAKHGQAAEDGQISCLINISHDMPVASPDFP